MSVFSSATNSMPDQISYDFTSEENAYKWKGLFVESLQKVQRQVHHSLSSREDALNYIESLILKLLGMLCACQPHLFQDVEERVQKTFPNPIDKWAIGDAQDAVQKGKKKNPLVLPVEKIHPLLQKEVLGYKVDYSVTIYIVAVLEYISADILKLAGNYVKNIRHEELTCQDIRVAMCADKVLMDMFCQDDDVPLPIEEEPMNRGSLTYEEVVKDMVHEENQYIRDLNMIFKVFRKPFVDMFPRSKDIDVIFSNIVDVHRVTVNFLGLLEDTLEMTEEKAVPTVGSCFEEMAESAEWLVYEKFTEDALKPHSRERLNTLLQRPDLLQTLAHSGPGFPVAVKYVLPKLLLGPTYHCLGYFETIKVLLNLSPDEEDKETLEQADSALYPLQVSLDRLTKGNLAKKKPGEMSLRFLCRTSRKVAVAKMNELQKSIDGWEGKDIGQSCNEFIMEGVLGKTGSRRNTERYVFLFDGLIILCKQNLRRSSVTGPVGEFRLKEKFYIRKIEIADRDDTEDLKYAFELVPRDQPRIVLYCRSQDEKNNWMAALVMLSTRSMLERMLDSQLSEEEKKHPLRLPNPDEYRFAIEDNEYNIVFEDSSHNNSGIPVIKGGTLLKLVERLTYHMYADPKFLRTFLTTYRSFCQPAELLDFLIERFEITEPPPLITDCLDEDRDTQVREDLKRFRKEYAQPVQFRVLNVLRHWVDQHFYDFERDHSLLAHLNTFIDSVSGKNMRKWVESITKIIKRRMDSSESQREITFEARPPTIEWHIAKLPQDFDLMMLHPIELARQLTLLEFDLYRAVKPSELVGTAWTKKDKEKRSPNLLKMIHLSTNFTLWLEKCIMETENMEERVAVVSRILEILQVLMDLNNFNGVLEIVSAMNSAAVYRLEHTMRECPSKLVKLLDEAKELNSDHFRKYMEKLRSIDPPCVPFFGMYLTNILHIEEGNPDFLPNMHEGIINFAKRRKVAEITGEIQQYQNQPYCLTVEPDIRMFLENLNPLGDRTEKEFNDYLYNKSLEIEPRNSKQAPKFPRVSAFPLKSPGIKSRLSNRTQPVPLSMELRHSFQQVHEDVGDTTSPRSPLTPSTPLTPPPQGGSDSSVFANVLIGSVHAPVVTGTVTPPVQQSQPPVPPVQQPPPLPPRRKRELSVEELSPNKVQQAPDAPQLPPRESVKPPIPPRRESSSTLPRPHNPRPRPELPRSATLPRGQSTGAVNGSVPQAVSEVPEPVPELPPKTYKLALERLQSMEKDRIHTVVPPGRSCPASPAAAAERTAPAPVEQTMSPPIDRTMSLPAIVPPPVDRTLMPTVLSPGGRNEQERLTHLDASLASGHSAHSNIYHDAPGMGSVHTIQGNVYHQSPSRHSPAS
ncbi:PREDICTED: son of sevenless homolog 1-like [Priapulus caudatus]|uniref:Son of sevenless homolog 1-like n=1 Tax=Priapulus caudatus TaxID=37621 RepID=A0ABM1EP21_PRICU|nr:PREDICTED: son of sevenless homolog 1-like [Priapulus caudatus]